MEKQKLAEYLKTYMDQGYSFAELKQHLMKNAVSSSDIDDALKIQEKKEIKQEFFYVNRAPIEINILAGIYFMFSAMLLVYAFIVFLNPNALPQSQGLRDLIGQSYNFSFFLGVVGILSLLVGYGVLRVKPWAKTEGMLISVAAAFTVIGLIVTVMTLYFFTRKEVQEAFAHSSHLKAKAREIKKENSENEFQEQ